MPRLARVFPQQIPENWEFIRESILKSLPHTADASEETMANIMSSLVNEALIAWVLYDDEDKVKLVFTTAVIRDIFSKTDSLLCYSLLGFQPVGDDDWGMLYGKMEEYCKEIGCKRMIAYSDSKRGVQLAEMFGADASQTIIMKEVT